LGGAEADTLAELVSFGPDVVIHVAAAGSAAHGAGEIREMIEANVFVGTLLMEAAAIAGSDGFVGIGTFWQQARTSACNETPGPNSLYASSKSALTAIADYYVRERDLSCVFLIPTDIYGPADPRRRLLAIIAEHVNVRDELALSDGEQSVSFVHVDDVIRAIDATCTWLENESGPAMSTFWAAGPATGSLRSTIETVLTDLGLAINLRWGDRAYRPNEVMAFESGTAVPGWSPTVALASGFLELVEGL